MRYRRVEHPLCFVITNIRHMYGSWGIVHERVRRDNIVHLV